MIAPACMGHAIFGGTIMIKFLAVAVGSVALLALAAPAQSAVSLSVSNVTLDTYNGQRHCLPASGCELLGAGYSPGDHSFANDGDSWSFEFGSLFIVPGWIGGDQDASVSVNFDFDPTATGDTGDDAAAKYGILFGVFTGGSLKWNSNNAGADPLIFSAGNAQFQLTLNNLRGFQVGNAVDLTGTITMLSHMDEGSQDTAAVPEPASWALMLGGFGMLGGILRSRRRVTVSFG
jgi:PEP-CTERM motif